MSEDLPILKVSADQQELLDRISEINEEALKPDGFESCVVGMLRRFNDDPLVLVDANKCIRVLMERDGMDEEEAREFFEFNTIGAWVGPGTPAFVEDLIQDTTEAEERLLKVLNDAWACLPSRCLYKEFNTSMSWDDAYEKLQVLEREDYPELGIVEAKKGMTLLSLLATVTDVLCGKRLAAKVDDDGYITGWTWWFPPQDEDEDTEGG